MNVLLIIKKNLSFLVLIKLDQACFFLNKERFGHTVISLLDVESVYFSMRNVMFKTTHNKQSTACVLVWALGFKGPS